MIIMPEHGRNYEPNPITDEMTGLRSITIPIRITRRIFTQMVGPSVPAKPAGGLEANPVGDAADTVLTIADILGIKQDVLAYRAGGFQCDVPVRSHQTDL